MTARGASSPCLRSRRHTAGEPHDKWHLEKPTPPGEPGLIGLFRLALVRAETRLRPAHASSPRVRSISTVSSSFSRLLLLRLMPFSPHFCFPSRLFVIRCVFAGRRATLFSAFIICVGKWAREIGAACPRLAASVKTVYGLCGVCAVVGKKKRNKKRLTQKNMN